VSALGGIGDLIAMQQAVQRDWTPASHWHIGDLAWQWPSMAGRQVVVQPGVGWAWITSDGHLEVHAPPRLLRDVLGLFGRQRGRTIGAMDGDVALRSALDRAGYRPVEAPFFRHCLRDLDDLPTPVLPDGYRIRPVRPGETAARAATHRAAWKPKRIGAMGVPPIDLGGGESGMTTERYRAIQEVPPYRAALDLVVEGPDGSLVASALGWYDDVNRAGLLEPVGTDPAHSRRGLGAAVSLACLHAMRAAGATIAKVCPRGDDAYPVPRHLYHHIGFRDAGRTLTYGRP
jgi:predicted N-acetyltransferase YhbS